MAFVFPDDKSDFLAPNGVVYSWDGDKWRTKSFKADVAGDSGLMASVQRVEDNLDLLQDTVGAGEYTRAAKPGTPVGPGEGQACFLQDGGAEATTFAEVENILLSKTGKGPYANFNDAKKGDYLLIQSTVDGDFGLYVIRNATDLATFWDFGLEISASKVVGTVPSIGEGIVVRTSRPTFTVAQDTPPDFSSTGQLWFDTSAHQLKVWDEEAQVFVETGGDGSDVHVGENPPADAAQGSLWYDSTRLELFVYYVDGSDVGGWVPSSPLGARVEAGEVLQQQILERVEAGEAKQAQIEADYLKKSGGEVTGRLDVTGPVFVSDSSSVFKRTNATAGSNYIVSAEAPLLPEGSQVAFRVTADGAVKAGHNTSSPFMASANNDVVTRAYAEAHTLQPDKSNEVTTSFRLKANGSTLISSSGNVLGLYHLKDPSSGNAEWAATKGYVDEQIAAIPAPEVSGDPLGAGFNWQFRESGNIHPGEIMMCSSAFIEVPLFSNARMFIWSDRNKDGNRLFPDQDAEDWSHSLSGVFRLFDRKDRVMASVSGGTLAYVQSMAAYVLSWATASNITAHTTYQGITSPQADPYYIHCGGLSL